VGVSYGVHEVSRLQAHGPRLIIDQLLELRDWLIVDGKAVTTNK
jgi:phosphoglycolate phosphatase-like HAD superfamily hydrolase